MKTLVIYDSITGNTKKIAEGISEILKCKFISIDNAKEYQIEKYDLVIMGTPVHGGMPTKKIKNFLKEKRIKKLYAVFCTYGVCFLGKFLANNCLNYMKKEINAKCLGEFKCPGFHQIFRMYKTRPNQKDLENAKRFAEVLLKLNK